MARRWWRMSREVCGDHNEQERRSYWYDREEIRVKTNKGAHREEGDGMGWGSPGEEALQSILEDKDNSYSANTVNNSLYHLLETSRTWH